MMNRLVAAIGRLFRPVPVVPEPGEIGEAKEVTMGHEVILGLYKIEGSYGASNPDVTAVNTTATGYNLVSLDMNTATVNPLDGRVTETLVVNVQGTSLADLRTKLAKIYDFADNVRRFEIGQNALYGMISLQPLDAGTVYASVVHAVDVSVPNTILASDISTWDVDVTIVYERDGYWQNILGSAITMSNPNGTGVTQYVFNCNDLTGSAPNKLTNYIDIDASDVPGDTPSIVKLAISNYTNDANGNIRIYVGGVSALTSADLPTLFYEAESATGGTTTADAACSGGNKMTLSISTAAETTLLNWTLANVELFHGAIYKVISRFAGTGSLGKVKFRWKLYSGSTPIWSGPQFMLENATNLIQELGEVPLPPINRWVGIINLVLTGQRTTSATETLTLDYIQLMASYCAIKLVGLVAQELNEVVQAPYSRITPTTVICRSTYMDWYSQWAKAIYINPGQYYRIHFVVQTETGGTAEKNREITVSARSAPRYRSIGE